MFVVDQVKDHQEKDLNRCVKKLLFVVAPECLKEEQNIDITNVKQVNVKRKLNRSQNQM